MKDLRPVEFEICKDSCIVREVMHVDVNATLSQLIDIARELLRSCRWQKVRVEVGSVWSGWIRV